jgi:hypothetical protein
MSGAILEDVALRHRLYLVVKPSHVGVDVNILVCPLHRPTIYSRQMRGHDFLLVTALSYRATVCCGAFLGMRNPWAWIFDGELTVWVPVLPNLYTE